MNFKIKCQNLNLRLNVTIGYKKRHINICAFFISFFINPIHIHCKKGRKAKGPSFKWIQITGFLHQGRGL